MKEMTDAERSKIDRAAYLLTNIFARQHPQFPAAALTRDEVAAAQELARFVPYIMARVADLESTVPASTSPIA